MAFHSISTSNNADEAMTEAELEEIQKLQTVVLRSSETLAKNGKMLEEILASVQALNESVKRLETSWYPDLATSTLTVPESSELKSAKMDQDIIREPSVTAQLLSLEVEELPLLNDEDVTLSVEVEDQKLPDLVCSPCVDQLMESQNQKSQTEVLSHHSPVIALQDENEYAIDEECVKSGLVVSLYVSESAFYLCTLCVRQNAYEIFWYTIIPFLLDTQDIRWEVRCYSFLLIWFHKPPLVPPDAFFKAHTMLEFNILTLVAHSGIFHGTEYWNVAPSSISKIEVPNKLLDAPDTIKNVIQIRWCASVMELTILKCLSAAEFDFIDILMLRILVQKTGTTKIILIVQRLDGWSYEDLLMSLGHLEYQMDMLHCWSGSGFCALRCFGSLEVRQDPWPANGIFVVWDIPKRDTLEFLCCQKRNPWNGLIKALVIQRLRGYHTILRRVNIISFLLPWSGKPPRPPDISNCFILCRRIFSGMAYKCILLSSKFSTAWKFGDFILLQYVGFSLSGSKICRVELHISLDVLQRLYPRSVFESNLEENSKFMGDATFSIPADTYSYSELSDRLIIRPCLVCYSICLPTKSTGVELLKLKMDAKVTLQFSCIYNVVELLVCFLEMDSSLSVSGLSLGIYSTSWVLVKLFSTEIIRLYLHVTKSESPFNLVTHGLLKEPCSKMTLLMLKNMKLIYGVRAQITEVGRVNALETRLLGQCDLLEVSATHFNVKLKKMDYIHNSILKLVTWNKE